MGTCKATASSVDSSLVRNTSSATTLTYTLIFDAYLYRVSVKISSGVNTVNADWSYLRATVAPSGTRVLFYVDD